MLLHVFACVNRSFDGYVSRPDVYSVLTISAPSAFSLGIKFS